MNDDLENNEKGQVEDQPDDQQADSTSPARSSAGIWLVALLALASLGLSAYLFYQLKQSGQAEQGLEEKLVETRANLEELQSGLTELDKNDRDSDQRMESIEREQALLLNNFHEQSRRQSMGNKDWALAEVEHLLVVATHRLQLEQSVDLALVAMQAADDRLKDIADPGLLSVRRQLVADMNSLKEIAPVDISGLALFLSDLVGRATDLPLKPVVISDQSIQTDKPEAVGSNWEKLLASIWAEMRDLVQVSKRGEDRPATLMPQQRYFLYQNLRLQLESARYAVLRRDTENLHVSVGIIADWLNGYFDTSDSGVANILESMSRMSSLELRPALPGISSSLETLRAHRRSSNAGPDPGVEESP